MTKKIILVYWLMNMYVCERTEIKYYESWLNYVGIIYLRSDILSPHKLIIYTMAFEY